jgi:hypothetical protein
VRVILASEFEFRRRKVLMRLTQEYRETLDVSSGPIRRVPSWLERWLELKFDFTIPAEQERTFRRTQFRMGAF